jgi:uncharacterized protein DUF4234
MSNDILTHSAGDATMTEPTINPDPSSGLSQQGSLAPAPHQHGYGGMAPQAGFAVAPLGPGPIGKVRGTGVCILLTIVTFGIYPLVWFFQVHDEMKRHKGTGLGGGLAFVLAFLIGIVMPYLTSSEAGELYQRRGQAKPVSGLTGLWYFPGMFLLVGPLIWFVQTNGAINAYWRSIGAR